MTLEWLLVLGAVAGIAAGSYLAIERVVDEELRRPAGPAARLVAADVVAAVVVQDAIDEALSRPYDWDLWTAAMSPFRARCEAIAVDFDDVVARAEWPDWDPAWTPHWLNGEDAVGNALSPDDRWNPAQCILTPRDLSVGR